MTTTQIASGNQSAVDPILTERRRAAGIVAACQMAGCLDRAAQYIEGETSLADVTATLLSHVCNQQPLPSLVESQQALKREYQANAALYAKQGISESEFLQIRGIESGTGKLDFFASPAPSEPSSQTVVNPEQVGTYM